MFKHLMVIVAVVLLANCQNQTGNDWLDPFVVKNYDKRVELTRAFNQGNTYCDFGCMHICTMLPEPRFHYDLADQNLKKFDDLHGRAKANDLLLKLPRDGTIIDPMSPAPLLEDKIATAKLECIRKQKGHLLRIEILLDSLAPKTG